jgi:hypothetical protein
MMKARHPVFASLLLIFFSTLFTLSFAELALRVVGKKPGYVPRYSRFRPVDKLEVYNYYFTDSTGVYRADPNHAWPEDIQINSHGFRGPEFDPAPTTQPKILFLGDSFTWGSSAHPITECFVDIIARRGFVTYNLGIPGTDPNQYAYLAEKYVPLLKPDIVAVMFYPGNDFVKQRPILPNKNLHHVTNAGMMYAFDKKGRYMSPQEAYEHYLLRSNAAYVEEMPNSFKGRLRQWATKTVVGTYSWVGLSQLKHHAVAFAASEDSEQSEDDLATQQMLARIKTAADQSGGRFMLFVIPVHPEKGVPNLEQKIAVLKEFDPFISGAFEKSDYMKLPNAHFNNSGHQKYAEFILGCINFSPLDLLQQVTAQDHLPALLTLRKSDIKK